MAANFPPNVRLDSKRSWISSYCLISVTVLSFLRTALDILFDSFRFTIVTTLLCYVIRGNVLVTQSVLSVDFIPLLKFRDKRTDLKIIDHRL